MAQIFISYSKKDRTAVETVSARLSAAGLTTWFDREIAPGSDWRKTIERELEAAECVIVLWSANALASDFVISESERGRALKKLVEARIEDVVPPLGFSQTQAFDLIGWTGDEHDPRWTALVDGVRRVMAGEDIAAAAEKLVVASNSRAQNAWLAINTSLEPGDYEQFLAQYGDTPLAKPANEHLEDLRAWAGIDQRDPEAIGAFVLTGPFNALSQHAKYRKETVAQGRASAAEYWAKIEHSIGASDYQHFLSLHGEETQAAEAGRRLEALAAWESVAQDVPYALESFQHPAIFPALEAARQQALDRANQAQAELDAEIAEYERVDRLKAEHAVADTKRKAAKVRGLVFRDAILAAVGYGLLVAVEYFGDALPGPIFLARLAAAAFAGFFLLAVLFRIPWRAWVKLLAYAPLALAFHALSPMTRGNGIRPPDLLDAAFHGANMWMSDAGKVAIGIWYVLTLWRMLNWGFDDRKWG
ncbi:MAG: toll/interleukin-1 receptor domain-containing protein [Pseudomonadota bacterium]